MVTTFCRYCIILTVFVATAQISLHVDRLTISRFVISDPVGDLIHITLAVSELIYKLVFCRFYANAYLVKIVSNYLNCPFCFKSIDIW